MVRQTFNEIIIRRQRETEINQAIEDLVKRGFVLKAKIQKHHDGKVYKRSYYGRYQYDGNSSHSVWVARLHREVALNGTNG
jgi:predicted  nucleic acid-binding Zn ribbon protein